MTERIVVRLDPATIEAAHRLDDYDFAVENETVEIPLGVWRQAHRFIIWTNQSPIVDIGDDKLYFLTKHNWTMETPRNEGCYWMYGNETPSEKQRYGPYHRLIYVWNDRGYVTYTDGSQELDPNEFEGLCMWQEIPRPDADEEMMQELKDFMTLKHDGGTQ